MTTNEKKGCARRNIFLGPSLFEGVLFALLFLLEQRFDNRKKREKFPSIITSFSLPFKMPFIIALARRHHQEEKKMLIIIVVFSLTKREEKRIFLRDRSF